MSRAVLESDFLKGLLDVLTQIVQVLADNPWVVQMALITAGITSIGALSKNFLPILAAFTNGFKGMGVEAAAATIKVAKAGAAIEGAAAVAPAASSAFTTLGATLGAIAPYAVAAGIAIVALIAIYKKWKENHPDIETMNEQLKTNRERLSELNNIPYKSRTTEMNEEIAALEKENKVLEENIRKKKQANAQQLAKDTITQYSSAPTYSVDIGGVSYEAKSLDALIDKLKQARIVSDDYIGSLEEYHVKTTDATDGVQDMIDAVGDYNNKLSAGKELTGDEVKQYQEYSTKLKDFADNINDAADAGANIDQKWLDLASAAETVVNSTDKVNTEMANQKEALNKVASGCTYTTGAYEALIKKYPELEKYMTVIEGSIEDGNALWGLNRSALYSAAAAGDSWAASMLENIYDVYTAQLALNKAQVQSNDYSPSGTQRRYKDIDTTEMLKVYAALQKYKLNKDNDDDGGGGGGGGTTTVTTGGSGSSKSEKTNKDEDERLKLLQSIVSLRKSEADLTAEQTDDADKLVAKYKSVQSALHDQANYMRSNLAKMKKQGASQQEINAYQESIVSLSKEWYSWESKIKNVLQEQAKAKKEAYKESLNAQKDALEAEQDELDLIAKYAQHVADEQIDKIQEQIDAIDKVNDALDDQIEKQQLLEALAQAKQKRLYVYKDGRFQYIEDVDAVTEAQQNLDEFNRKQLDKEKKEALETEKKRWEEYKDGWSNLTDSYDYEQGELLYLQKYGTRIEKQNWDERLQNLDDFIREYRAKAKELEEIQNALNNIEQNPELPSTGGNTTATTPDGKTINVRYDENGKVISNVPIGTIIHTAGGDYQVTGGTPGNYTSVKVPSGTSAGTQVGGGGGSDGFTGNFKATLPDGTTKDVHYENGKLTTDIPAGSIIHTAGGDYTYPGKSGGGSSKGSSSGSSSSSGSYTAGSASGGTYNIGSSKGKDFVDNAKPGSTMKGADGSTWTKNTDGSVTISKGGESYKVRGYAGGTMGAFGGIAMVGEQGPELRVLNKGDGILPADITRNLFKIGSDPSLLQNKTTNQSTHINVSNITLPNVTDAKSFIDGIKSMAIQRAYAR